MEACHWEHSYAFADKGCGTMHYWRTQSLTEFSESTTLAQQEYRNAARGNAISHPQCNLCMWYLYCHQYNLYASVFPPPRCPFLLNVFPWIHFSMHVCLSSPFGLQTHISRLPPGTVPGQCLAIEGGVCRLMSEAEWAAFVLLDVGSGPK